MSTVRSYRDLKVWNDAVEFAISIYKITEGFPKTEQYGLTSQLRRAAVSVSSNIAEGEQRETTPDYIRFCRVAKGSTAEIDTQLEIAKRLKYLDDSQHGLTRAKLEEIRRMLSGLIESLGKHINKANSAREDDPPYGLAVAESEA